MGGEGGMGEGAAAGGGGMGAAAPAPPNNRWNSIVADPAPGPGAVNGTVGVGIGGGPPNKLPWSPKNAGGGAGGVPDATLDSATIHSRTPG